jgi:RIO-like serine/threonine protein kinase
LLHYEEIVNGWKFIVMETIDGTLLTYILRSQKLTKEILEPKLLQIKKVLQAKGLVHDDLREANLMLQADQSGGADKVMMLDFDWAGKEVEARCPLCLNTEIRWPKGAVPGEAVIAAHDKWWLDKLVEEDRA